MKNYLIPFLTICLSACVSGNGGRNLSVMNAMISQHVSYRDTPEETVQTPVAPESRIDVHPFVTKIESIGSAWEEIGLEITNNSDSTVTIEKTYLLHDGRLVGINYYSYSIAPFSKKVHDLIHFDSDAQVYQNTGSNESSWREIRGVIEVRVYTAVGDTTSGFLKR